MKSSIIFMRLLLKVTLNSLVVMLNMEIRVAGAESMMATSPNISPMNTNCVALRRDPSPNWMDTGVA